MKRFFCKALAVTLAAFITSSLTIITTSAEEIYNLKVKLIDKAGVICSVGIDCESGGEDRSVECIGNVWFPKNENFPFDTKTGCVYVGISGEVKNFSDKVTVRVGNGSAVTMEPVKGDKYYLKADAKDISGVKTGCILTITVGGSEESSVIIPGFEYDGSGDHTVWVNGKDIKDDKRTPDVDETAYYKTCSYLNTMMSSGGKWSVVVTDASTDTVEKLTALYNEKGALNDKGKTVISAAKKLASAKIKDGVVTVTAGKETGTVRVWVVEIKNKLIFTDKKLGVTPQNSTVDVIAAPGALCFAETSDVSNGVLITGKKALSKLDMKEGDAKTIAFCDKKGAFSPAATFELTNSDPSVASVTASGTEKNQLAIKALKVGNTTTAVKNIESGKAVKIKITVK